MTVPEAEPAETAESTPRPSPKRLPVQRRRWPNDALSGPGEVHFDDSEGRAQEDMEPAVEPEPEESTPTESDKEDDEGCADSDNDDWPDDYDYDTPTNRLSFSDADI